MKSKLLAVIMLAFAAFTPSCAWLKKTDANVASMNPAKVDKICAIVDVGTKYAVNQVIKKNPDTVNAFGYAADAISLAIADSKVKPENLQAILDEKLANQDDEVKDLVALGVDLALLKYSDFYEQNITNYAEGSEVYAKFLASISSGIRSAVAEYRAASAVSKAKEEGSNPMATLTPSTMTL